MPLPLVLKLSNRAYGLESSQAMSGIEVEVETNDSETDKVYVTLIFGFCTTMTWPEKILMPLCGRLVLSTVEFTTKQHAIFLLFLSSLFYSLLRFKFELYRLYII